MPDFVTVYRVLSYWPRVQSRSIYETVTTESYGVSVRAECVVVLCRRLGLPGEGWTGDQLVEREDFGVKGQ